MNNPATISNTGTPVIQMENLPPLMSEKFNKKFIIRVSFVAALGGLLFGFDTAIISGTILYITTYFSLDAYMLGWSVSSILIGCAVGAMIAGAMADRFGRKYTLMICALLFAISGLGAALSHQLALFVFFRLVGGLGVGAAAMVSPMYIAEMAPAKWRGRLVAFYQMAIVFGILLAYLSNYLFDGIGNNNWRWMFASQVAPSILFLVCLLMVPESPRWLIRKARWLEASAILAKISGTASLDKAIMEIENSFHQQSSITLAQLFSKQYAPVVFIGIMIAVFQQVTGINSILYYAPVIFKETGIDSALSLLQTIGIGVVNVISTFIAIGLVDKVGRRKFLLVGALVMGISLTAVALCFQYHYFQNYLVLAFMLLYVAAFGCTLGAVTWVYLSEIFPNLVRGMAMSVATLSLWLADFLVTYTFPIMTRQLGTATTMFCYAAMCVVAFVFIWFKVKETKGRTLEEIESVFLPPQTNQTANP